MPTSPEPLGFESIWTVEHHFTDYTMCPDPQRCAETIQRNCDRLGAEAFVGVFGYAGMPAAEAERNMRTFAERVMPVLKERPVSGRIDWAA